MYYVADNLKGGLRVQNFILLGLLGSALVPVNATPAEPQTNQAIEQLAHETVSRLEWGMQYFKRALIETFSINPQTLESSAPPFFINVSYVREDRQIVVEIGRTFASVSADRAAALCIEYVERVRSMLSVDPVGRPAIGEASSLAADFFHPLTAPQGPAIEFAQALDRRITLRALVASPVNGVFSICGASLTHSPIRHLK